jgi:hypothetical protein
MWFPAGYSAKNPMNQSHEVCSLQKYPRWSDCGIYILGGRLHGRTIFHLNGKLFHPAAFWNVSDRYADYLGCVLL